MKVKRYRITLASYPDQKSVEQQIAKQQEQQ